MTDRDLIEELGPNGATLQRTLMDLRDGGPPVDLGAIVEYASDGLDEESARVVRAQVVTWRSWYEAYVDAMHTRKELESED